MGIFSRSLPHAQPGRWFGDYHGDWDRAHPGAWTNGTGQSGGFCKGDVWVTCDPDFDKQWFARHGMSMPRRVKVADLSAKPGELRIGTLQPGESAHFEADLSGEEPKLINRGITGGRPSGKAEL